MLRLLTCVLVITPAFCAPLTMLAPVASEYTPLYPAGACGYAGSIYSLNSGTKQVAKFNLASKQLEALFSDEELRDSSALYSVFCDEAQDEVSVLNGRASIVFSGDGEYKAKRFEQYRPRDIVSVPTGLAIVGRTSNPTLETLFFVAPNGTELWRQELPEYPHGAMSTPTGYSVWYQDGWVRLYDGAGVEQAAFNRCSLDGIYNFSRIGGVLHSGSDLYVTYVSKYRGYRKRARFSYNASGVQCLQTTRHDTSDELRVVAPIAGYPAMTISFAEIDILQPNLTLTRFLASRRDDPDAAVFYTSEALCLSETQIAIGDQGRASMDYRIKVLDRATGAFVRSFRVDSTLFMYFRSCAFTSSDTLVLAYASLTFGSYNYLAEYDNTGTQLWSAVDQSNDRTSLRGMFLFGSTMYAMFKNGDLNDNNGNETLVRYSFTSGTPPVEQSSINVLSGLPNSLTAEDFHMDVVRKLLYVNWWQNVVTVHDLDTGNQNYMFDAGSGPNGRLGLTSDFLYHASEGRLKVYEYNATTQRMVYRRDCSHIGSGADELSTSVPTIWTEDGAGEQLWISDAGNRRIMHAAAACTPVTAHPTRSPTISPTRVPTPAPSASPTAAPTLVGGSQPSAAPTAARTLMPTPVPGATATPTTGAPTLAPGATATPTTGAPTLLGATPMPTPSSGTSRRLASLVFILTCLAL